MHSLESGLVFSSPSSLRTTSRYVQVINLLYTSHSSAVPHTKERNQQTTHIMCVSLRPSLSCLSCSIWFTRLPAPHLCLRAPSSLFSLPSSLHLLLSPSFSSFFPPPSFFLWQIMPPNQKAEFVGLYSFASYIPHG